MKSSKTIIVVVILFSAAIFLFIRESNREDRKIDSIKEESGKYWYCEGCQKEFFIKSGNTPPKCPKCNEVITIFRSKRRCKRCNTEFVAFDMDLSSGMSRQPGGDWQSETVTDPICPKCGSPAKEHIVLPERKK